MDCRPPGSSVQEISLVRILEWVAISFSRKSSQPRDQTQVSHIVDRCFTICTTMEVLKVKVVSNSLQPYGLYGPWNSPGQNTGVGSLSLLQGIFSTQGPNPGLSHNRADSIATEPLGKLKKTGVGNLSLPQQIFLTQGSNQGLSLQTNF